MNEQVTTIEALLPADLDAQRLVRHAPALWRDWGLVVVALGQIEDAEPRAALQKFGEALYGAREAVCGVEAGQALVAADGARWEALSASDGYVLARRVSDGALASFHQPGG